jgi:Ni/Fe-hydrogenase subunit HybB-like protein
VIVKREENGRLRTIRTVGPGEQFGETSALEGTARAASAIAEAPTRVLRLTADALRILMTNPGMSRVIHERMHQRLLITDHGLLTLRSIVQVSMLVNVFLLLNEVFKEFYTDNLHVAASRYLYFGLHGHNALVPWIWTAVVCNVIALVLLMLPVTRSLRWLDLACILAIVGIWIEKGMGLVVPGFIPSPLGEIVEYTPSLNETLVCFGIWAFGLLCYTLLLRIAVPILQGRLTRPA